MENEAGAVNASIGLDDKPFNDAATRAAASLDKLVAAGNRAGQQLASGFNQAGTSAESFAKKIEGASRAAAQQFAILTASTDRQRISLQTLGVAYDKLSAEEQEQINNLTAQVNANKKLEASLNADAVASNKLAAAHRALGEAGGALTALVTAPLLGIAVAANKAAVEQDGLRRGLGAVLGSLDNADAELVNIRKIGEGAGLGFEAAARGVLGLKAAGLTVKEAEAAVKGFGLAVAEVGKGKDTFEFVQNELVKMASNSRVSGIAILELSRQLPQLRQALKASFGTSDPFELEKMGKDSTTVIAKVSEVFNKINISADTLRNRFDNTSDSIQHSLAQIGDTTAPLAASFLEKLTPAIESVSSRFAAMPEVSKNTVLLLVGLAASAGPVAMLANQFISLSQAAATAQISIMGPVGLVVALGALGTAIAALSIAGSMNDESDKMMADAGKTAAQSLHERVASMRSDVAKIQELLKLPAGATNDGSGGIGDKATRIGDALSEAATKAGVKFKLTAGDTAAQIKQLQEAANQSEALAEKLDKQNAASAAFRDRVDNGKDAKGYDIKQDAALGKSIESLKQQVQLFGNESEVGKIKWEIFHGVLTRTDPLIQKQAIDWARQLDALNAAQKAADKKKESDKEATEQAKKYSDAVRESNKQLALSRVLSTDPNAAVKRFDIEQRYADDDDKLPTTQSAQIRANTALQASEAATRAEREKTTKSLAEANKKLEESIKSLREKQLALSLGEEHLTDIQLFQIQVQDALHDSNIQLDPDFVRKKLAILGDISAMEASAKATAGMIKAMEDARKEVQDSAAAFDVASLHLDKHAALIDELSRKYASLGIVGMALAYTIAGLKIKTDELNDATRKSQDEAKAAADKQAEQTHRVAEGLGEMASRFDELAGRTDYLADSYRRLGISQKGATSDMAAGVKDYAEKWELLDTLEKQKKQIDDIAQAIQGPLDHAFETTFSQARMSSKTFFASLHKDLEDTIRKMAAQSLSKALTGGIMHALGQASPSLDGSQIDKKAKDARDYLFAAADRLNATAENIKAAAATLAGSVGATPPAASANNFATAPNITVPPLTIPTAGPGNAAAALVTGAAGAAQQVASGNAAGAITSSLGLFKGLASSMPWIGAGFALDNVLGDPLGKLFHLHLASGAWSVPGHGMGDSVPAMLTPGEMVLPHDVASKVRSGMSDAGNASGDTYNFHGATFNDRADVARIRAITNDSNRMKFRVLGG